MTDENSWPAAKRVRLFGVALVTALLVLSQSACSTSRQCGDYDRVGTQYHYTPGKGDYNRVNGDYVYVGCRGGGSGGGGGGVWIFGGGKGGGSGGGSGDNGGSSNRGGGPGWGK